MVHILLNRGRIPRSTNWCISQRRRIRVSIKGSSSIRHSCQMVQPLIESVGHICTLFGVHLNSLVCANSMKNRFHW